MAEKFTLNLFAMEDKLWTECYLRAVQGYTSFGDSRRTIAVEAPEIADQYILDLRARWPGKDKPEIGG
jgi:hypothetical protein